MLNIIRGLHLYVELIPFQSAHRQEVFIIGRGDNLPKDVFRHQRQQISTTERASLL